MPISDARAAVELACQAAHLAEQLYAYDEAVTHYRRGLEAVHWLDPPDPRVALRVTVRLAAVLHHRGDPAGLPMLLDAGRRARAEGDDAALVNVATSFSHFGSAGALGRPKLTQLGLVEAAIRTLGTEPSASRARLLIERAAQLAGIRVEESIELAREAESIARRMDDPDLLGAVLLGARHVGRHPSRMAEYERIGVELERLGQELRSLALTLAGVSVQTLTHLERGDVSRWMDGQRTFARLLGDRSLTSFQLMSHVNRASRDVLDGRFDEAEERARAIGLMADSLGFSREAYSGPIVLISRRLQARDADLIDGLERIASTAGDVSVYRCSLAAVRARIGAPAHARHILDALRSEGYDVPKGNTWAVAMAELAEAAEVVGDAETAAHVVAELGPFSGNIATTASGINRPLDQALAQAALAAGDHALAEEYAVRAVTASRHRNTPVFLGRELVFLAHARRCAGVPMDEVRPLVGEAQTIGGRLGTHVVRVDLERYGLAGR